MKTGKIIILGLILLIAGTAHAQIIPAIKDAFAQKAINADSLVGTWIYKEPAVLVTSNNLLMKAAGNLSASKLEKLLAEYIEKSQINEQNTSFTFRSDGTFVRSIAGRKAKGVWMMNDDKLLLAIKNVQTASLTTHIEGDSLMLVAEAGKVMQGMQALGAVSDSKITSAIINISKNLSGIGGGFTLIRKKVTKKK
jgi:hypothetical protein